METEGDDDDDPVDELLAAVARIPPRDPRGRASDCAPPAELDEYRLIRPIGRGGMGSVWLAEDQLLGRLVAVKFIAHGEPDKRTRDRFAIEARAAARLQHVNVVTVYRYGELAGRFPYLVSEYIRGESLDKLAKPIPWERSLEIGIELARGLAAAHRHGIVHRDIKPANAILTSDGGAKLVDFGLAKLDHSPDEPSAIAPLGVTALTDHGTVAGTPRYLAPEVRNGEPASRRSDVYQIGCILYELVTGRAPLLDLVERQLETAVSSGAVPVALPSNLSVPSLVERTPGPAGGRFARVVDCCLQVDPNLRFASGDELREALEQVQPLVLGGEVPEGNPYRGLLTFESEHRALFFGRGPDIRAVVERLRGDAFVLVTGDSGVGKSSLCRAGVLPQLAAEREPWTVITLVPGSRPLATLASLLVDELELDEALEARLRDDPASIARELRRAKRGGVIVFVDQLEELATIADRAEAAAFAGVLAELAAGTAGIRLLATVRSDFLTRVAELPAIGSEIARAIHLLGPLTVAGTREAIVGPAHATGVRFESEALVETLVTSIAGGASELPLLAFTLAQLWEARDPATATISEGSLAAIGGVRGALARHADRVIESLLPEQRAAARKLLLRLITADTTRIRRSANELANLDRAALDALVRGRLVVVRGTEEPTYELAHERLVDGWPMLAGWIADATEAIAVHARLATATADWERLGRSKDALWGPRQLLDLAIVAPADLTAGEAAFVRASRRARSRRRWLRSGAAVAVMLVALAFYVGARLVARRDLDRRVASYLTEARREAATAREAAAANTQRRAAAFAKFDAGDLATGEQLWTANDAPAAAVRAAYVRSARALEAAFLLDTERDDVRRELAQLTYERLLLAAREYHDAERAELEERLGDYDPELLQQLAVPARILTTITPATAAVELEGPDGTPIVAGASLAPGTYVVIARAEGYATVRVPTTVRAKDVHVTLAMPQATRVPHDFVYIPQGTFLYGSREGESVRRFFGSVPMHEVTTPAFLIGRTEVTYAQWIAFLDAQDEAERTRRTPKIAASATVEAGGTLELRPLARGNYELRFSPANIAYTATMTTPIRYADRLTRREQDWLQFPVSGVSPEDAIAYAAWLDRSKQVPHARLCTEQEWERGMRGVDGRPYPHGDRIADDDANFDATYRHRDGGFGPDAAGSHPRSTSPHGLVDGSGNVWEIVRTRDGFVTRGGSYYTEARVANLANRMEVPAAYRHIQIGVRICADPSVE